MDKTVIGVKKPRKKKPKDKPKRPLSAYNYFFREEREKITRFLLNKDDTYGIENGLDLDKTRELMTEKGKVKFEEVGKLIGKRWKSLGDDAKGAEEIKRYSSLASVDAERYKKELQEYNELKSKQEAERLASLPPEPPPDEHDKRGHYGSSNGMGGYPPSYMNGKDSINGMNRMPDPHYGGYPQSMYSAGSNMYYPSYQLPTGGSMGSYPPNSMPPGGQSMGAYSHPYDQHGYGHSYGSPPYSSAQHPSGTYGGDSHAVSDPGAFRPGSHSSSQQNHHSSTYGDSSSSTPQGIPPPYEEQSYDPQGNPGGQNYPYHGSSHYAQTSHQHQGGPYPPSYGQSWGPGYGGEGQKSQHWGGPGSN